MKIVSLVLVYTLLFFCTSSYAQKSVGTLTRFQEALDGYTFFSTIPSTSAYMIDNCGRVINKWEGGPMAIY